MKIYKRMLDININHLFNLISLTDINVRAIRNVGQ